MSWEHQERMTAHFDSTPTRSGMLWVPMGGGKSKATIDAMENDGAERVLIVAPSKVVPVWPREFAKWGTDWAVCAPTKKLSVTQRAQALNELGHETGKRAMVVNYDALWRGPMLAQVKRFKPQIIVADESHRAAACPTQKDSKIARTMRELSLDAPRRFLLTGTPAENSPLRWWSQMFQMDPNVFGWQPRVFDEKVCVRQLRMVGRRGAMHGANDIVSYRNLDWLAEEIRPYVLAMTEEEFDYVLPEQVHTTIPVDLEPKTMRLYGRLEKLARSEIKMNGKQLELVDSSVGAQMMAMCQGWDTSVQPWVRVDRAKLDVLHMLLEDLGEEPVVVVSHFKADVAAVADMARAMGRRTYEVSGTRDDVDGVWQADSGVLSAQIRSAALGVDLTAAHRCIFFGTNWDAEDFRQIIKRIHRPGQKHVCRYWHIVAENTVDKAMRGSVRKKTQVADNIRDHLRS